MIDKSHPHEPIEEIGHEVPSPGNPDLPAEGAVNVRDVPESLRSAGPQNVTMERQFPSQASPPPTDIKTQPFFWSSFNISPKRIQRGGWAREITADDFALSEEIAGVNMHLAPGGVRELHWHQTAEWAIMTRGHCRVTTLDFKGVPSVEDVEAGDLWYFPAGCPHSLQGLGPDGAEFVLAFDGGEQSESNTLLVTDFLAHVPLDVLAKNFGVPESTFRNMPLHSLWIFQGQEPGSLAADQAAVGAQPKAEPVIYRLSRSEPVRRNCGGQIQIADSHNFRASKTIAAAMVTIEPGGMRELHWHPNADEWQYYLQGEARMTVFDTGPKATTTDFRAGDVGLVKRNLGHYVENTGRDVLKFMEIFRAPEYLEVSLADWLSHTPPALVMQHFNLSAEEVASLAKGNRGIVPL
ncbi:cupin domain-containing protein [Sphingomonas sp. BN140010]|uniref:Cupin domain-containing protein n=1 Tax=Sphingomonas arvum TaxID=2992113 RepID=A0ABT3JDQ5_9SPHN|nr:cupin domain-containing protein [Sphingomonas sp. BN140010]MCW3797213.1 cupin domain-containing protein [Sphingomonas sp. BN140010]